MNLRRPKNIIFFESKKTFCFCTSNNSRYIFFFNLKKKKLSKKKRTFKNSKILKKDDNNFFEYFLNSNSIILRNLSGKRIEKISLSKNFNIKDILYYEKKIIIFAKNNNKNFIILKNNKATKYICVNFEVEKFKYVFFFGKLLLANKINSKIYEYILGEDKLVFKFGNFGREGKYNFRNISFLISTNNLLYINDRDNYKIKVFDKNYKFKEEFGSKGIDNNNFDFIDSFFIYKNNIIIADTNNDRILKLNKNKKSNTLIAPKFNKGVFRRPIKTISHDNKFVILDRDNRVLQIFSKDFNYKKHIDISDNNNSKPNSITKIKLDNKIFFLILFRQSNFKNYIKIYDNDFNYISKKLIASKDAQDLTSNEKYIFILDTLGRKILIFNKKISLYKKIDLVKVTGNKKILSKSISIYNNLFLIPDFEKCKLYFLEINGKINKIIDLSKFKKDLGAIRFALRDKNKIFILSRNSKPIWTYNIKNKKIYKYFKRGVGNSMFYNPTHLLLYLNYIIITDKENDQIKLVKNNFSFTKVIPQNIFT